MDGYLRSYDGVYWAILYGKGGMVWFWYLGLWLSRVYIIFEIPQDSFATKHWLAASGMEFAQAIRLDNT